MNKIKKKSNELVLDKPLICGWCFQEILDGEQVEQDEVYGTIHAQDGENLSCFRSEERKNPPKVIKNDLIALPLELLQIVSNFS
jgi:hypothetical protein